MTDFASLGIKVDSTQVQQAKTDLDALADAGDRAGESAKGVAQSTKGATDAMRDTAAGATTVTKAFNEISHSGDGVSAAGSRILASLQDQIAIFGKTTEEILQYRAAQAGVGESAEPLIATLRQLQTAQQESARAALQEAVAEREANQTMVASDAARTAFLAGLREQIAVFGKSSAEVLQYKAALVDASGSAAPLIAQLQQLQTAQEQAAAAAERDSSAQRGAAAARLQSERAAQGFVANLTEQIALFGKSAEGILQYRAALLGVSDAADPLIANLKELKEAEQEAGRAAQAEARAEQEAAQEKQRLASTNQSFIQSLRDQIATQGKSREEILAYRAAQLGISNEAAPLIRQLEDIANATHKGGVSAGQTRAAFQQLHFQITDMVTGLSSGQNPLTVLIQQGGQIKDSFGGIGPMFRALTGAITPAVVGVGALGAGVALLAAGYVKGSGEAEEFRRSIITSGNAAGVTTSALIDMAAATDRTTGTQYEGAKALAAFAASGKVAAASMKEFSDTSLLVQKAVGQSVADTIKQFEELRRAPVEAIAKLNESMHFLDTATYNRIKALQDQGREEEAAALAQKTYSDAAALRAREVIENFSPLESLFSDIKDGAKRMWDGILNVGREDSLEQQIAKVKARLAELQSGQAVGSTGIPLTEGQTAFERQRLETLQESLRLGSRVAANNAAAASTAAAITEKYIEAGKELDRFATKEERWAKENIKLRQAFEDRAAGGSPVSQAQQEAILAEAREKIFGKGHKGPSGRGVENAQLQLDVEAIRAAEQKTLNIYQNSGKILEAQRRANLVDESDYYEAKREFVLADAQVQIDALKAENARIAAQKSTGKDRLDQDKQIAKNKAEIVKIQQNADATLEVLAINEGARNKKIADGYKLAEDAARDYLDQVQRAQRATIQAVGMGSEQASRQSAIDADQQRYEAEKRKLTQQRDTGQITQAQFERLTEIQNQFQAESLAGFRSYYAELDAAQGNWINGITKGFADFSASSKNVAKTAEQSFTHMLNSVEDAFVNFIMTGKLDWKSLADSIVADILRVIVQAEALQLVQAVGGASGAGGMGFGGFLQGALGLFGTNTPAAGATADFIMAANAAPMASGGDAQAGSFHLVNEKGPELLTVGGNTYLMMGDQPGYVTPNGQWGGGGFTQNVYFSSTGPIDKRTQMQLGAEVYKQGQLASSRNN